MFICYVFTERFIYKPYLPVNTLEHMCKEVMQMPKKNVTLSVDLNLYENYVKYCKKRGLVVSRQVEMMIEEQMKNGVNKDERTSTEN